MQATFPTSAMAIVTMTMRNKEQSMLDILMLAFGLGFFALAIGYTYACERL